MSRSSIHALPPEWEIDLFVAPGMSGGYRRVKDGLRLQRHARLGIWILMHGEWATRHPVESHNPPLAWADALIPLAA